MIMKAEEEIDGMKECNKCNVESKAFKIYPSLFKEVYIRFTGNPTDEVVQNLVKKHYSFPAVDNPDVRLSPPFLNVRPHKYENSRRFTTV